MKMTYMFREVTCCPYCLQGLRSHGERIFQGGTVGEGTCDVCDEVDELVACMWEVE